MSVRELIKRLENGRIVIYGTGHVARKFLKVLQKHQLDRNIVCFAVSAGEKEKNPIEGFSVQNIREIRLDSIVCLAVHEAVKNEMEGILQDMEIKNYIWIYPYLYELLLGAPVKKDVKVKLKDIMQTCKDDYRISIRHVVIDNYNKKNINGFDLYIRAQALHCNVKTAEERLKNFCELIRGWQLHGYDESNRVFINEDYEIIDGIHRIALANYYGQGEIMCHIFKGDIRACDIHGENVMLTKKVLLQNGFTIEELEELDEINKVIKGERRNESISE